MHARRAEMGKAFGRSGGDNFKMNELAPEQRTDLRIRELALFAGNGGVFSGGCCLVGAACAPSNSTATAVNASPNGKMKDTSNHSQFGARVQVSGRKGNESFAKFDPASESLWRTHQSSLLGGWESFSETWPNWGMMQNGECWALTTWEDSTFENGCSLWATPIKRDWKDTPGMATHTEDRTRLDTLPRQVFAFWPTATKSNPNEGETLDGWMARREAMKARKINGNGMGMPLGVAIKLWPTVLRSDAKAPGKWEGREGSQGSTATMREFPEATASGAIECSSSVAMDKCAPLNPDFVEWLMGWPIGWTASLPLATDRFRQWLPQRGESSAAH